MRGLSAVRRSQPTPRRSATPGRTFSMTTSPRTASRSTISRPSAVLRSTLIERLPRFQPKNPGNSRKESPSGDSTLTTSAPMSASCIAAYEPAMRSEEHTSELQSQSNLVCRLLLEKKKKKKKDRHKVRKTTEHDKS